MTSPIFTFQHFNINHDQMFVFFVFFALLTRDDVIPENGVICRPTTIYSVCFLTGILWEALV
jgi:hypothetical protein